jgi:hypothetical protein
MAAQLGELASARHTHLTSVVAGCLPGRAVVPVHYLNRDADDAGANLLINRSQLMQLTIAALPRGSHIMW